MKKEYLIIATVALAVLMFVSSVPAMQSAFIPEYQPVCPEESYNKITELYEEGLSEERIAEELAFPLDIVNRYLEGNYTPPPCPESNQSISPSECPTYSKIKDLYGEGWSEEEIAETLELPIDVVNGFLSGNYTIISSCPEPYQAKRKMGTGVFNITNNTEQNQAQERQDVPISPKPNMSVPLKPTPTGWVSLGPNISIPLKPVPPTEWWESLEFFKQLTERGERGISNDTIELVETIADSLVVNESFKQASEQVSISTVRNNKKCEIVEIKRVLEDPIFLPSVNGSVYFPEREEVSVKIRREEGSGTYYEHGVYFTGLQNGDDGFIDYRMDIPDDSLVDGDCMKNNALWVTNDTGFLEVGIQLSDWEDPNNAYFYTYDGFLGQYGYYSYAIHSHIYTLNLVKNGQWIAYVRNETTNTIVFNRAFTSAITPTGYSTGIEVADRDEDRFGEYPQTNVQDIYGCDGNFCTAIDYTNITTGENKGARVDPLDNNADDLNWWAESYPPVSLGEAVDNTDLSWTTGGPNWWFGQTSVYHYGGDAAQSGTISHNQESWTQTTVTGPGTLKFYWKVSSEANFDFLRFYIDGVEQERISGTVDWQPKTYGISSGSHTLKWAYTKDGSVNSGSDCGWLDKVEFGGDSYEPDNSFDQYSTMSVTSSLQSQSRSIDPTGDNDYIRFYAYAGKNYIFYTEGSTDTYGYLYDSNHNQLTYDDDSGSGLNFRIEYPISSSGYYFLRVRGYSSSTTGPYTLYYKYETGGDLITSKSGTLSGTGDSYTFSVSGYSTVTVVMAGNENADFDLYAKWGQAPTTSDYDAIGYSSTSLEYFTTSGSGTLYIMVRSYSGSGNWKCWALSGSPGANSGRKSGTLSGSGDTATYSLSGTGTGYAFNSGPDGSDFDLYTKWNSPPTTSSYDARGYSSWAQEIAGPASGSGTLYFMVRSYSGSGEYATVALIF